MSFLLLLCIFALPIGTRFLLGSVIPGIHEYEAILFYGSDIALLIFVAYMFMRQREATQALFSKHGGAFMFALLIAGFASACLAPSFALGVYGAVRVGLLVAFAYAVGVATTQVKIFRMVVIAIAILAVLQSIIGILQFARQENLGLQLFGEASVAALEGPASTITAEGGRVLRAYGTFAHPNIFAGFLALGLIALSYLYLRCEERLKKDIFNHPRTWWNWRHAVSALNLYLRHPYFYLRLLIAGGAFIVTMSLLLTFSRSGWIATATGLLVLALVALRARVGAGAVVRMALMVAACVTVGYLMFAPLIAPRAQFARTEPAVNERLIYGRIGVDLISGAIGGVGAGNQVLYGVNNNLYQKYGLTRAWYWEPVHNLYLLIAAELGWLGLLSFVAFLGMVAFGQRSRELWRGATSEWAVAVAMLSALLVAGLFDHYLWTLQAGKLMLWLVIGLVLAQLGAAISTSRK